MDQLLVRGKAREENAAEGDAVVDDEVVGADAGAAISVPPDAGAYPPLSERLRLTTAPAIFLQKGRE